MYMYCTISVKYPLSIKYREVLFVEVDENASCKSLVEVHEMHGGMHLN